MKKQNETTKESKTIGIYLFIVLIFLGGMYLFTDLMVTRNKRIESTTVDNGSVSIQYREILLGEVFSQKEEEYLVLCYDKQEENTVYASTVSSLISANVIKLYTADLSHALNRKLVKEESNHEPTKASELAIHGATLLHFKDGSLVDYIEGQEEINAFVEEYK